MRSKKIGLTFYSVSFSSLEKGSHSLVSFHFYSLSRALSRGTSHRDARHPPLTTRQDGTAPFLRVERERQRE